MELILIVFDASIISVRFECGFVSLSIFIFRLLAFNWSLLHWSRKRTRQWPPYIYPWTKWHTATQRTKLKTGPEAHFPLRDATKAGWITFFQPQEMHSSFKVTSRPVFSDAEPTKPALPLCNTPFVMNILYQPPRQKFLLWSSYKSRLGFQFCVCTPVLRVTITKSWVWLSISRLDLT